MRKPCWQMVIWSESEMQSSLRVRQVADKTRWQLDESFVYSFVLFGFSVRLHSNGVICERTANVDTWVGVRGQGGLLEEGTEQELDG